MLRIGLVYGLTRIRVPAEPPDVLACCGTEVGFGDRILFHWTRLLRWQARRAGVKANDACFGLAWSGHMTTARILRLLPEVPEGETEIYFHPAARRDALLDRLMPDYEHEGELAALLHLVACGFGERHNLVQFVTANGSAKRQRRLHEELGYFVIARRARSR